MAVQKRSRGAGTTVTMERAAQALRRSEQRFQRLVRTIPYGIVESDRSGRITFTNAAYDQMMGCAGGGHVGRCVWDCLADDTARARMRSDFQRLVSEQPPVAPFVGAWRTEGGAILDIKVDWDYIRDESGQLLGFISVITDITDERRAQEALRAREEKYRLLVENQTDLVVQVDLEGHLQFVSPSYCRMFQESEEELLGRPFMPLVHEDDRAATEAAMQRLFEPPYTAYMEQRAMTAQGWRWLAWVDTAVRDPAGQVVAIHGVGRDITERKETALALQAESEKFRVLVEDLPLAVCLIGPGGVYKYVNPQFVSLFGYEATDIANGREWFRRAFPDADRRRDAVAHWLADVGSPAERRPRPRAFKVRAKDGSDRVVMYRSAPLSSGDHLVIYEDITEQKRLEHQLLQASKMEAVGTLASGVAHDFNNLLQAIGGYVQLLSDKVPLSDTGRRYLGRIEQAAERAAELVSGLLAFSRKENVELRPVNVNQEVAQAMAILERTIPKMVEMRTQLAADLRPIRGDSGQLEQVLMNLATNARDAMPGGGVLSFRTENVVLRGPDGRLHPGLSPGEYVRLVVADTGCGIAPEHLDRIFEPFFTTKAVGRGTGLGLSTVYGVIQSHGGAIQCRSQLGQGAEFEVLLPVLSGEGQPVATGDSTLGVVRGGEETLLLVDDEEALLELEKTALEQYGYTVLTATSGEEAVERFRGTVGDVGLVVLDLGMPGMGGRRCLDALREIDAAVRVLVVSGYAALTHEAEVLAAGARGFVSKPYRMTVLARAVREALDS